MFGGSFTADGCVYSVCVAWVVLGSPVLFKTTIFYILIYIDISKEQKMFVFCCISNYISVQLGSIFFINKNYKCELIFGKDKQKPVIVFFIIYCYLLSYMFAIKNLLTKHIEKINIINASIFCDFIQYFISFSSVYTNMLKERYTQCDRIGYNWIVIWL